MHNVFLIGGSSAVAGLWAVAAAISFAPLDDAVTGMDNRGVVGPDPEILAAYRTCSRTAEVRMLSLAEATECSEIYLLLKLSFLPDMDVEAFKSLPPIERWEIQQRGYAAYRAWQAGEINRKAINR